MFRWAFCILGINALLVSFFAPPWSWVAGFVCCLEVVAPCYRRLLWLGKQPACFAGWICQGAL